MNSTSPAPSPEQTTSGVSADHPGVNELFALLAYGEVAAFYRLTEEARMAPNLRGRINMASMSAAEMNHYEVLRDALERRVADVVRAVLSETAHSQFVVAEVQAAVTASEKQRHRLALWSRRLLGEAITQAQYVMADHDELVDLVMSSGEGLSQMTEFFDRLQRTHSTRTHELGLA